MKPSIFKMKLKEIRNVASFRLLGTWMSKRRKECTICRCCSRLSLESLKMFLSARMRLPGDYTFKKLLEVATKLEASFEASGREKKYTIYAEESTQLHFVNSKQPRSCLVHLPSNFSLLEHRNGKEVVLTTQLQYRMTNFLQQTLKHKNRHKGGKKDRGYSQESERLCSCAMEWTVFAMQHFFSLKTHQERPKGYHHLIIQACHIQGLQLTCYSKCSANPKATRLTSS